MKVENTGQAQSQVMQQLRSDRTDQKTDKKEVDYNSKKTTTVDMSRSKAKAKGVIKKLQESHFSGVAELRLGINFANQLQEKDLPQISEPKGGSSAYIRFLEMYGDLGSGAQDTDETLTVDESGDIQTEI